MTKLTFVAPRDEEIERLQMELDEARRAIVNLMPEPAREILGDYYDCKSRGEVYRWESTAADKLIELAQPLPRHTVHGERAMCPLCGGGAQNVYAYQEGFSLPLGLHRHLTGFGNTHQCDVTRAAFKLAREWARDKFKESELREKAEADAQLAARKATETLYRTDPYREPDLLGGQYAWRPIRDKDSLSKAEERLEELGFKRTLVERVKSYTQEHPGCIVYADLRENGRIEFRVFKYPLPPPPRKAPRKPNLEVLPQ